MSLISPKATRMTIKSTGKPPKLESILIPSNPDEPFVLVNVIITQAMTPISKPQTILIPTAGSGLSGEIPAEEMPLMAEVFESAAVT